MRMPGPRSLPLLSFVAGLALAATSCGSNTGGTIALGVAPQCNPLRGDDPMDCATPWPSSTYEVAATGTASGVQVSLLAGVLPANDCATAIPPDQINAEDGFSPTGPIVVHFKQGIKPDNLPPGTNLAASLAPTSPTQILDLSGHRQLHFSEVDVNSTDPTRTPLFIRPMTRLLPKTTYVVVLTKALTDPMGNALPVPAGMQALLDGSPTDNARLEAMRPDFAKNVLPALAAAGIPTSNVLLAWDYTTGSDELLTARVSSMRDQALAAIGDGSSISYTISSFEYHYGGDSTLYARIVGTFDGPLFLNDAGRPVSTLLVDANGKPKLNGTYPVSFAALIPAQAEAPSPTPLPVVLFGHGLLGNGLDTSTDPYLRKMAHDKGVIFVFSDWTGLSTKDIPQLTAVMADMGQLPTVTDKLQQSIVNFIALLRFTRTGLASYLMKPQPTMPGLAANVVSQDTAFYVGGSLGGIMGNAFMAYDPDITQAILNVPGGNWSLMIQRSSDWPTLDAIFSHNYPDVVDQAVILAYSQSQFDYADPITTSPYVLTGAKPLTVPPKHFLMQEGRYDMQVSNLATEMVARTLDIPLLVPSDDTPYGLAQKQGPLVSGLTIYDLMPSVVPNTTDAPNMMDNGVHTGVYREPAAERQILDFLSLTGTVVQECSGTMGCICAAPANACM